MIELPAIWPGEQTTLAKSLIMVRSFRVLRNAVNKFCIRLGASKNPEFAQIQGAGKISLRRI
jgi:hypothetical protein